MTGVQLLARSVLLLVALLCAGACRSGCGRSAALAQLEKAEGTVDRDHAAKLQVWTRAPIGAEFFEGDAIRTAIRASAVVRLDDGSRAALQAETIVRFLSTKPGSGEHGLDVVAGEAVIEVGSDGMKLRTSVGLASLDSNTRIRLAKTTRGVRYEVLVGKARVDTTNGPRELTRGSSIEVGLGDAILDLDRMPAPSAVPATPAPAASEVPDDPTAAIALEVSGPGVTLTPPDGKTPEPLTAGAHAVKPGSTVTVPKGRTAVASRGNQRATLGGAGRFVIAEPGGSFVRADSGQVSVLQAPGAVSISVPGGVIITQRESTAGVSVHGKSGSKVSVSVGEVEVRTDQGTETLHAGEEAELRVGGRVDVAGRGPAYAEITITAGEALTVHDPKPPTAVGVRFGDKCPRGAIVELLRGAAKVASSSGQGSANMAVPAGSHPYRVRCLSESGVGTAVAAKGSIAVRRDSGTAPLPKKAPLSLVDADGRTYTVLYQNQLPSISLRWRDAPSAGSFTLEVSGATRKTVNTAQASYTFKSGDLAEGRHQLVFSGGGKRSRSTTLVIRFDNATPAAHITSPADQSFSAGASVTVSGVALPGWTVSVQGQTLEMDAQARFSGQVVAPAHALVIRFAYPGRGVRYYLRRAAGASQ
jgi:hypothetical protein